LSTRADADTGDFRPMEENFAPESGRHPEKPDRYNMDINVRKTVDNPTRTRLVS